MFSGSADAGFVLALPLHHEDLKPDCVGVLTRGLMHRIKIPWQDFALKMQGYAQGGGGAYLRDTMVITKARRTLNLMYKYEPKNALLLHAI